MKTFVRTLAERILHHKYLHRWVIFLMDLGLSVLITLSVCHLTLSLLYSDYNESNLIRIAGISVLVTAIALLVFPIYRSVIRHTRLREVWRFSGFALVKAVLLSAGFYYLCHYGARLTLLLVLGDFFVTIVGELGYRIVILNIYNLLMRNDQKKKEKILIYGTGDVSASLAMAHLPGCQIQGFITFNPNKKGLRISDFSVYAVRTEQEFDHLMQSNAFDGIVFPTIQDAQREKERLVTYCNNLAIKTYVVPAVEEMKAGQVMNSIRPIRIEDLLGREEIKINMQEIGNLLTDKVVMVTGAAGSIGSEICRQLARFDIKLLVLFDNGETPTHNLRLELEEKFPNLKFIPVIGDVRSIDRVDFAFRNYHPQVVFHAAAYKHVPLMEENPCEAIRVNVYGTRNVADYSVKYGVERFVMISTDKAVNPTNIMGCSKRIAEIYVQSLSLAINEGRSEGHTKFITTRFGNVLGSNGSVIPRFREQIAEGGPVTVTHPDIIRFFMTIPEACRLVLEAGTMGNGGEIFVFDMGEPVKIADLAKNMIRLAGLEPDKDIQIVYTGLRPGEKLYEEVLSTKESTQPTPHEKIRVASVRKYDYQEVVPHIELLSKLSSEVNIPDMVMEMKKFVPEFKSKNSIYEKYDK